MARKTIVALMTAALLLTVVSVSGAAYLSPRAAGVGQAALAPCPSPYTVRAGDNLSRIARTCGTTLEALKAANGLTGDLIRVGQQLTLPNSLPSATPSAAGQPKVVIAVVDGWRYEETYGDPMHQYIPYIWNDLRPQGTWYSNFYNLGQTLTAPGHAAILGGVWQPISNEGTGRPTAPTLFEYYRKATGAPASDTALVFTGTNLGKAAHWAYSSAPGYGEAYGAVIVNAEGFDFNDKGVLDLALGALGRHPRLMLVAFPAVDENAHLRSYEDYLGAIQTVDEAIWQLWNALQADPLYAGQTTLFVTNDHGRRLDDFRNHGGNTDSERHVTLLVLGPQTPAGLQVTTRRTQVDIAPTVGNILGFPTPLARGHILWEVLQGK